MYQRKEKSNNTYYPSFLCMEVDTPDYLDTCMRVENDKRTEAAFLHEYIHYLQDITTVAGNARIGTIVDQIKWAVGDLAKRKGKFKLPLNPNTTYSYNMKPNASSLKLCKGDFRVIDRNGNKITPNIATPVSFELEDATIYQPNGTHKKEKAQAIFKFKEENGTEYKYAVGELAISESMAFLIEDHIYPDVLPNGGHCPYMVVKKIVQFKLNQVLDYLSLIAICDVCLMYSFPGIVLYYLLDELQKSSYKITPATIYALGLSPKIGDIFQRPSTWIDELRYTNSLAKSQMCDYFVHPYWKQLKTIVGRTFDDALDYRINHLTFFLDIARGGRLFENRAFQIVIGTLGCLSVKTSSDLVYNFLPKSCKDLEVDADWFLSLHQLYNVLFTNDAIITDLKGNRILQKECELKEWCHDSFTKKGEQDITCTSYNCKYAPWENKTPQELAQCSFGRLWSAYGLNSIKLKV